MSSISPRLKNKNTAWSQNLRPRVGATVAHKGFLYTNVTGINGEPGLTTDWLNTGIVVPSPLSPGQHVFNKLVTDVSDNEFMIVSGTYTGGDPDKKESYSLNSMFREL